MEQVMDPLQVTPRRLRLPRPSPQNSGGKSRRFVSVSFAGLIDEYNSHDSTKDEFVLAFKLQTNASKRFNVQPAQGFLRYGESKEVTIQLKHDMGWSDNDKFLVRAVLVDEAAARQPLHAVWKQKHKDTYKAVIRCEYGSDVVDEKKEELKGGGAIPRQPVAISDPAADRYMEMLIKNLSTRPEDALTLKQLEELQILRRQVGPQAWGELQEQAKLVFERRNAPAQESVSPPGPPDHWNQQAKDARTIPMGQVNARAEQQDATAAQLANDGQQYLLKKDYEAALESYAAALDKHAGDESPERAMILSGIGSVYEAAGLIDSAINFYIDSLKVYDLVGDHSAKRTLCETIARKYAGLRDHAMSAAWYDRLVTMTGNDLGTGAQRTSAADAKDHQMKIGNLSERELLTSTERVNLTMYTRVPRGVICKIYPDRKKADEDVAGQVTGAKELDTMWEPARAHPSITRDPPRTVSPPVVQPRTYSYGGTPHYLSATAASRAARLEPKPVPSVNEGRVPRFGCENDMNMLPQVSKPFQPKEEVVRRNHEAATLHVRRALDARRRKDQIRGVKPPTITAAKRKQDLSEVYLEILSLLDKKIFVVDLAPSLSQVMNMTVRDIRERVSSKTGIELHDFELLVDNTALVDSWTGEDIGVGACTRMDLQLLPGVPPEKYGMVSPEQPLPRVLTPNRSPHDVKCFSHVQPAIPTPPTRRPPPPVDDGNDTEDEQQPVAPSLDSQAGVSEGELSNFTEALMDRIITLESELESTKKENQLLKGELKFARSRIVEKTVTSVYGLNQHRPSIEQVKAASLVTDPALANMEDKDHSLFIVSENSEGHGFDSIRSISQAKVCEDPHVNQAMNSLAVNVASGEDFAGFVICIGGTHIVSKYATSDFIKRHVRSFFASLPLLEKALTVRAVAFEEDGSITDLLEPSSVNTCDATVSISEESFAMENSMMVLLECVDDFERFYDVLLSRTDVNAKPRQLVLLLESETSKRKLVFLETNAQVEIPSRVTKLLDFASKYTKTLVFCDDTKQSLGRLEKHFKHLKR